MLAPILMVGLALNGMRWDIATALYERYVLTNKTNYRVHVGTVGDAGARGRTRPGGGYVSKLASCKIVVTSNPPWWEGDSRLGEALVSGALVLSDRMVDPPPKLIPGENALVYDNVTDMLAQVQSALEHPAESARIAARGFEAAETYPQLIERVLRVTGILTNATAAGNASMPQKVPVLLAVPGNANRYGETWGPLDHAVRTSTVARHERNASRALAILIDNVMVEPGKVRFFKGRGGVRDFLNRIWPAVLSARASVTAREVMNGTRLPIVIGLDFDDASDRTPGSDNRIDVMFKRSRVIKARGVFSAVGLKAHPLHYPVKQSVLAGIHRNRKNAAGSASDWSSRRLDVCCFFDPRKRQGAST